MDGDGESWLTGWEQQCADIIEGQPDYEQSLTIEADNSHRKIWTVFQDSATAIAQLYRERHCIETLMIIGYGDKEQDSFTVWKLGHICPIKRKLGFVKVVVLCVSPPEGAIESQILKSSISPKISTLRILTLVFFFIDRFTADPGALWISFQTAAGTVTTLYKESTDCVKRSSEIAKQCGYQKRNRELLNWAKRKRTLIRREDLLAYLSGKPPPPRHSTHHGHHRLSPRPRNISPPPGVAAPPSLSTDMDLNTFTEALARSTSSRRPLGTDLCAFITGEIQRHCKRPASPSDVTMGSPTHQKRPRYM
ncbi:hypothetical protein MML48_8g00010551 [Holotrichia oblita]|uniref:Uncharacterized protein n=1 Tax=Holotrichia oblita TaxID=644536 RepID=A0ACB9SKZ9_HOLOL|nr:hypothetical protein MML48_8g00010551 [Holotrichia oblita]